jgi:hypothetical protein
MNILRSNCFFALCLLSVACSANSPTGSAVPAATGTAATAPTPAPLTSNPYASSTATTASKNRNKPMDDLQAFATNGDKILTSKVGDLNGDGKPDALLVLDPPTTGNEKLGEGPPRRVLILIRDANGQLQKVAQNNRLVPCAQCGGIAGDPFSYMQITKNGFTVVTEGGSRQHWSHEYTFAYAPEHRGWLLHEIKSEVTDQDTGKHKQIDLTPKDFGTITFANFDPSTQKEVELP